MFREVIFEILYQIKLPFYYISCKKDIFPLDLKICISTHKNYSSKSLPILLNSLKKARVPLSQIFIFEGGHLENTHEFMEVEINFFKVNYNSFDITALIGVIENNLQSKSWLLLHDTVTVFPNFTRCINRVNWRSYDTVSIKNLSSMNMGFYKGSYINNMAKEILRYKNTDYSENSVQRHKQIAIDNEDFLFKKSQNNFILKTNGSNYFIHDGINYCGVLRRRETFMNIGIVKYKANYTQKSVYQISI